ncbi:MAG TPA: hypothetical protein QKA08_02855 [Candidatus Megaira endosymbiont of Nemacystus decipiens]|nr:hypothetical protein [Candidatus Megaera endosymbiont of Nemacystus decipiens]
MAGEKSEGAKDPDLVLAGKLVTDMKTCLVEASKQEGLAGNLKGSEVGLLNNLRTTKGNYEFKDKEALTAFVSKMSDLPSPSAFVQNNYEALNSLSSGNKDGLDKQLQAVAASNQGKYPKIYGKKNPKPTVPAVSERKVNIESEKNTEKQLIQDLDKELQNFADDDKMKIRDSYSSIVFQGTIDNNRELRESKITKDLVKVIDSSKFTPEKLIDTVDNIVDSYGTKLDDNKKQEYKDKILSAATKLADSKGKIKEQNVILAEELANGMKDLWKAKEKQGSPIAGTQELLKDKNSPLREFTNKKTGKVEFKNQEDVKKFSEKLDRITKKIQGEKLSTDLTLSNNNAVFKNLGNGKDPNPETLKTVKGTIELNKTNNKSIPKKISSALKNQAASIGKAALEKAKTAKENVVTAVKTVAKKVGPGR